MSTRALRYAAAVSTSGAASGRLRSQGMVVRLRYTGRQRSEGRSASCGTLRSRHRRRRLDGACGDHARGPDAPGVRRRAHRRGRWPGCLPILAVLVVACWLATPCRADEPPVRWDVQYHDWTRNFDDLSFVSRQRGWVLDKRSPATVFSTSDGGQTWNVQYQFSEFTPRAIVFVDTSHGFAFGTAEPAPEQATGALVIWRTEDGGASWAAQFAPFLSPFDAGVVVEACFVDPQHGWVLTEGGGDRGHPTVFATSDGGDSWAASRLTDWEAWIPQAMTFGDEQHGWVVGRNGCILATVDGGAHWEAQASGVEVARLTDVSFVDKDRGWISGSGDSSSSTLLHTQDGGATWQQQVVPGVYVFEAIDFAPDGLTGWVQGSHWVGQSMLVSRPRSNDIRPPTACRCRSSGTAWRAAPSSCGCRS